MSAAIGCNFGSLFGRFKTDHGGHGWGLGYLDGWVKIRRRVSIATRFPGICLVGVWQRLRIRKIWCGDRQFWMRTVMIVLIKGAQFGDPIAIRMIANMGEFQYLYSCPERQVMKCLPLLTISSPPDQLPSRLLQIRQTQVSQWHEHSKWNLRKSFAITPNIGSFLFNPRQDSAEERWNNFPANGT